MNSVLPSTSRSFLLTIGLFLFFSTFYGNISAQTYFLATEIETIPTNPDDQTPTSVRISGLKTNVCSYLSTSSLNVNASFTVLNMDWDNEADTNPTANCPNFAVPWDTTFQLGILNGGPNAFYFSGNNYALSGVNNPTVIQVAASDCDSGNTDIAVTNTNDEGPGSLRQALVCANAQPGFNRIVFNLTGNGPDTIRIGETSGFELPSIFDDSTFIDGTSHPAFGDNGDFSPKVVLDGQFHQWDAAINALFVRADDCAIYGLEIINFPDDAIDVLGGDDVIIGGINRGNVIHNNGLDQDFFPGNPGQGPWEGCGIVVRGGSDRTIIQGNYIGTNYLETTPNGNEFCGILIRDGGDLHQIGGDLPGMGNVIVNNATGMVIGGGSVSCRILQNSFYCNDSIALRISPASNNGISPPAITIAENGSISGTAAPNQSVALYRNDNTTCTTAPCQGGTYLGTATVVNGVWTVTEPFVDNTILSTGDLITAIATDITGNSSEFADCASYTGCSLTLAVEDTEGTTCGADNGTADLSVSGGAAPYVFSYNGQISNNPNLINLSAGNYQVTVTDGNNCTAENSFIIVENPLLVLSIASQNSATCNEANGSFILSVSGGRAPFVYSYNGNSSGSPVFNNLLAGTYNVTVTDADDCSDLISVTVEGTSSPTLAIDELTSATCGEDNGGVDLTVSGGMAPYVFSYDGQTSNSSNLTNLSAGTYDVTVTDGNDCTAEISFTIAEIPEPILSLVSNITATCDEANGGFTLSVNGGQGPYVYTTNGMSSGVPIFNDLLAGTYDVLVTDADGCTDLISVIVPGNSSPVLTINELTMATCGEDNGEADLSVSGGVAPYTFSYNGQTFNNPNLINLSAGTYDVIVTDGNNCTSETSFTITANPTPVLSFVSQINASCNQANGSFILSVNGGRAPYIYTTNGISFGSPVFDDLLAGTYEVMVTDADGCTDLITVVLTDSDPPIIAISELNMATCGETNGSLMVVAVGGVAPYIYSIEGVEQDNGNFNNLAEGIYSIEIRDANNCTAQLNAVISDTPPITVVADNIVNPMCGVENGEFSVVVTGGTAPFDYTLNGNPVDQLNFSSLVMGTYLVTVVDAVGCMQELTVNLVDTGLPEVTITQQTDDNCNDGTGAFSLEVMGGVAPYEFDLGTGRVNTGEFSDLFSGIYQVTVTDANSCSEIIEITLENNGVDPVSSFTFELIDNQITAQSTSVGANNLEWDFGDGGSSTANTISHEYLGAGIYSLCLTAINDCGSVTVCESVEVVLPLSDYTIAGSISRTDGPGINQVTVACTDQSDETTDVSGNYLFEGLPQGDDYEITPTKDINHSNGVTVLDIIDVRAHLLFIDTFNTPYQYIAADVNRNGSVTVFDLIIIQQIVLEAINAFPQNTSWDFLPADYTFDYASQALNYTYPQSIVVNDLNTDELMVDFIGVKIGDTNGSNNPSLISNGNSSWQIKDRSVAAGEIIEIPVRISAEQALLGYEAALNFDPSLLELQTVTGVTDYQLEDGKLKMLWYTEESENQAVNFTPETDFITLRFLAYTDLERISEAINFDMPNARQLAYDAQRMERTIDWSFTDAVVTDIKTFDQYAPKFYPNPFNEETFFTFELTRTASVDLEIYDLTGKAIYKEQKDRSEGLHKIMVSGSHFSAAGTYFYRLKIGESTHYGQVVKQ